MLNNTLPESYSARVTLSLISQGKVIPLRKIGPGHCVAAIEVDLPIESVAELVMTVDGQPRRWRVMLPNGAVPYDDVIRYVEVV